MVYILLLTIYTKLKKSLNIALECIINRFKSKMLILVERLSNVHPGLIRTKDTRRCHILVIAKQKLHILCFFL